MVKKCEKVRKNEKNGEKMRKIGTFLGKNEKKREKMRRFLTAGTFPNLASWYSLHQKTNL